MRPTAFLRRFRSATHPGDDSGFTLVEMLVTMILSSIVAGILLSLTLSAQHAVTTSAAQDSLNGEARVALNRISRDVRQATPYTIGGVLTPAISAVQNPDGTGHVSGAVTSITINGDYNGDGCITGVGNDPLPGSAPGTVCQTAPFNPLDSNPEIVTYCWTGSTGPNNQQIWLVNGTVQSGTCTPKSGDPTAAQPLLSGQISAFEIYYRSNNYLYDANGDGITTWQEVDAAGNNNGILDAELPLISSIVITMTVTSGTHSQTYQTQVDLRNVQ